MRRVSKVLLCSVVLIAVLVASIYLSESPRTAYKRIQREIASENWEFVYTQLSKSTRKQLQMATAMAALLQKHSSPGSSTTPSAKSTFAVVVPASPRLRSAFEVKGPVISNVLWDGDRATLTVTGTLESTSPRTVTMLREDGGWKLHVDLGAQ